MSEQNKKNEYGLLTLGEIFKNRTFLVPDYQRGYSWEESQLSDLKKDIENIYYKDYLHFTGTLVAAEQSSGSNSFDIIDGQQRLTTLIILLNQIFQTDKNKYQEIRPLFLYRGNVGNERFVLKLNDETREFFEDHVFQMKEGVCKNKSQQNIRFARQYFSKWLIDEPQSIDKIYKVVTQQLGFILFTPQNSKEIGIMFEVINNRGKHLSELEKIKNYFIYYSTIFDMENLRRTINDKWKEIQEKLSLAGKTSNEDENNFLRYAYLVFFDPNKNKSHSVYDELKQEFPSQKIDKIFLEESAMLMKKFVEFLADASRYYSFYFTRGEADHYLQSKKEEKIELYRITKLLTYLRCHPVNASIMPLFLSVMSVIDIDYGNANGRLCNVADLLELIEKTNFRLYILPSVLKRTDSRQGELFSLAYNFYKYLNKDTRLNEEICDFNQVKTTLQNMIEHSCPIKKMVQALTLDNDEDYDYYNWGEGLRFFLSCYEEKLKKEGDLSFDIERMLKKSKDLRDTENDYLSIEHIWARKNMKDDFQPDFKEKRRLGNLVLLGLNDNKSQQDLGIQEKIQKMVEHNSKNSITPDLFQLTKVKDYLKEAEESDHLKNRNKNKNYYRDISVFINDRREEALIAFALERWKLKSEKKVVVKVDTFKANLERKDEVYDIHFEQ